MSKAGFNVRGSIEIKGNNKALILRGRDKLCS
jgi:hypothetical protein